MKKNIFLKIFAGYIVIICLLAAFILVYSFRTTRLHYLDTLTSNLENLAATLSLRAVPLIADDRIEELDDLAKKLGKEIRTRITIIAPDGTVLADSEEDPAVMENHGKRPEVLQALGGGTGGSLRYSVTMDEDMLYVAIPAVGGGETLGVLRVSLPVTRINQLLDSQRTQTFYYALVIVFLSILAAGFISRSLSGPMRDLGSALREIAQGNFGARVEMKGSGESRELAGHFNKMAATMESLFSRVDLQAQELNGIISSLQESLFVIDRKGTLSVVNDSFRRLIGDDNVEKRFWWEIIREPGLSELLKRVIDGKDNEIEEIEFRGRIYLCSLTFSRPGESVVAMLHDITEIRNLEKIKRDFVINISHELRTPLTAIKGFVETLKDQGDDEVHYFDIIERHTNRLIGIVDDLFVISELERDERRLELADVDLHEIIQSLLGVFRKRAEEKGLDLEFEEVQNIPQIKADPFRLEQMFINLLDNAIKYTDQGGITIRMARLDSRVSISIEDTGIGIPREHQSRVFERFYVVDKSRSRKLGGTGLGLSIVKHIVLSHKGEIKVESRPEGGSRFTVVLPVDQPSTSRQ